MAVFDPFVSKLSSFKVPRAASVLLAYLILIGGIGFAFAAVIPPLIDQTTAFINNLPRFMDTLGMSSLVTDQIVQQTINQLGAVPAKVVSTTVSLFSNFLGIAAILVFAFYLLSERNSLKDQLIVWLGEKRENDFEKKFNLIEERLGSWARGQVTLMIVIGLANYIGLSLLGIPFSLPLSILAGLMEIIPYIGPIVAAVPAVLIGFGISPIIGSAVAAMAFLIQQLENFVLVPKIMQKSTGINPIITLLVLAVGARLAGLIGLLIAVPVFITFQVVISQYVIPSEEQ
jgi:predicted PurR-regulated permease PerM